MSYLTFFNTDLVITDEPNELKDAVIISLFTDRRANVGDLAEGDYQYGWWADTFNDTQIGSRLYLLKREKITETLIPKIDSIVKECLKWLIDDKIVSEIVINTIRTDVYTIQTTIKLIQNNQSALELDYTNIWEGI